MVLRRSIMPTYSYECEKCGEFEARQSMTEEAFAVCPKCGGSGIRRIIGKGGGVIFKGSGFYETDYKKKTPSSDKPADSPCASCDKAKSGECK